MQDIDITPKHDQLPSLDEVLPSPENKKEQNFDNEASSAYRFPSSKSQLRFKVLSALLFLTTLILSIVVGVLANSDTRSNSSGKLYDETSCRRLCNSISSGTNCDDSGTGNNGSSTGNNSEEVFVDALRMETVIRNAVLKKNIVSNFYDYKFPLRSVQARALEMVMKESRLSEELVIQHYALWCFYFATEHVQTSVTDKVFGFGTVPHWKDSWTNDGSDPCLWNGVRCKSGGIVAELNLEDNQITGALPEELKLFDSLTRLNLKDNPGLGEGGVPTWLNDIETLDFINFTGCTFSGQVHSDLCNSISFLYADCVGDDFSCPCCNLC